MPTDRYDSYDLPTDVEFRPIVEPKGTKGARRGRRFFSARTARGCLVLAIVAGALNWYWQRSGHDIIRLTAIVGAEPATTSALPATITSQLVEDEQVVSPPSAASRTVPTNAAAKPEPTLAPIEKPGMPEAKPPVVINAATPDQPPASEPKTPDTPAVAVQAAPSSEPSPARRADDGPVAVQTAPKEPAVEPAPIKPAAPAAAQVATPEPKPAPASASATTAAPTPAPVAAASPAMPVAPVPAAEVASDPAPLLSNTMDKDAAKDSTARRPSRPAPATKAPEQVGVVCFAGCHGLEQRLVYDQPVRSVESTTKPLLQLASLGGQNGGRSGELAPVTRRGTCIAGCHTASRPSRLLRPAVVTPDRWEIEPSSWSYYERPRARRIAARIPGRRRYH